MRLLKPILRNLLFSPRRIAVIDDQRTWRAIDLYIGALHLAKAIKKQSSREKVGLMLPYSGTFAKLGENITFAVDLLIAEKGGDQETTVREKRERGRRGEASRDKSVDEAGRRVARVRRRRENH